MSGARAQNVLIVHGIGWGDKGEHYADALEKNIGEEFERALSRLHLRDVDRRDTRAQRALRFRAAYWSPITQKPQNELIKLLHLGGFWLVRPFNPQFFVQRQMIGLLGDVISYEGTVYQAIHKCIHEAIEELDTASEQENAGSDPASLTVIGHSLGSVIASDYLWDHTRTSSEPHHLTGRSLAIKNLILMGSPMALYALRNNPSADRAQLAASLSAPIQVDPDGGLWLNCYDPQDPIAFPLHPIDSYADAGVIDYEVKAGTWLTGWTAASHVGYWRSAEVATTIGRKLALDWAGSNSPQFADRYLKAVESFRKGLRH
jgi:hypothetical protein